MLKEVSKVFVNLKPKWVGIDYGSKLAGTTVICCVFEDHSTKFYSSEKGKDADSFVLETLTKIEVDLVFLDAPLSLPAKYFGNGESYFFRLCDTQLKAMSPMFLGGLTARAIQLKGQLIEKGIKVQETYPAALVRTLEIKGYFKKKGLQLLDEFVSNLAQVCPLKLDSKIVNWHHADAFLAAFSGYRFQNNEADIYGNLPEGVIVV